MNEGRQDAARVSRWLAWATAALLTAGVASTVTFDTRDSGSGTRFVSATGRTTGTVEVSTTVTAAPTSTLPSTPTTRGSLPPPTVPPAAAAVLRAIASTLPPAIQPPPAVTTTTPTTTPTTAPPVVTTTPAPTTTRPPTSTTSTTVRPTTATVTLVNNHTVAFAVTVNGVTRSLGAGEPEITFDVQPAADGKDAVDAVATTDSSCKATAAGAAFQAGVSYRIAVVVGTGAPCTTVAAPELKIT